MIIILIYYFVSTIVPIDKIIGKIYPVFGVILISMALAVIIGVMVQSKEYPMIELIGNLKDFSKENGSLPWWPFMMTTVACGAVSGFHATQSPMIAKCIKSEKEGRQVFYGAMVAEGVIALIWAAAAMAFFRVNTIDGWGTLAEFGGSSTSVNQIARGVLGPVGTVLAIVGVVICPITSGDTALRSCRLIVGEWLHIDPKDKKKRILLTIPLFVAVIGISLWNFLEPHNFNILWRWFAWSNQVLAAISLWVATGFLFKTSKNKYLSLFTAIPAIFMTMVVSTYIFAEPQIALGRFIPYNIAMIIGAIITLLVSGFYIFKLLTKKSENVTESIEKQ
jgi:carbon starvation protein CstA